ncbi:MAG: 3-isopropylmalate dehydratase [Rhizobacter sp.]|nr:3-isopropylmalate dehydratase [Rhizobacter sp.]
MSGDPHKVWRLGADIDTDLLAPGHAMKFGVDVIAKHCLEVIRPEFAGAVKRGDVIVAGPNFGIGSSREQAAAVLVALGVAAVVAPSYSGLYFRNAFNLGLLLLTCPLAETLNDGDLVSLQIGFDERSAPDSRIPSVIAPDGRSLPCEPIPDFLMDMVRAGGLMNQLRRRFDKEPLDV